MNAALLANMDWLDRELPLLRQLVVGLVDEQVRVMQVVPGALPDSDVSAFSVRVDWDEQGWLLTRPSRLQRLGDQLDAFQTDLIHAIDASSWRVAMRLSQRLDIPVVLTISAENELVIADKFLRRLRPERVGLSAATQPLHDALEDKYGSSITIHAVPPGVHVSEPRLARDDCEDLCAVVSGRGVADHEYEALFDALRQITHHYPGSQFFLDGAPRQQHELWQLASRYDLLENITLPSYRPGHRELLLHADVLIQPQPMGGARTLALQAMASALPIISRDDPWVDYLTHDTTAWIVDASDTDQWVDQIRLLIERPDTAQALGRRARDWVGKHRRTSQYVSATLSLYRQLTGESIPFPGD
jgi:glycosyltransferase involved in cell wall biosynthesis